MTPSDPSPKKTETFELRLSPEEKERLKTGAAARGLSVSQLIRNRLADILEARAPKALLVWRAVFGRAIKMVTTAQRFLQAPHRAAMAIGAGALLSVLAFASASRAEDVQMDFAATITKEGGAQSGVSTASSVVDLNFGQPFNMEVREPGEGALYRIRMTATPGDDAAAMIAVRVARVADGVERVLAEPSVLASYNDPASIKIGGQGAPEIQLRIRVSRG